MLVSASNFSVLDEMVRKTKNTTAGLNRVFEFAVRPAPAATLISIADASMTVGALETNYGRAGERYHWLAGGRNGRTGRRTG
jgi:hypothetical protein